MKLFIIYIVYFYVYGQLDTSLTNRPFVDFKQSKIKHVRPKTYTMLFLNSKDTTYIFRELTSSYRGLRIENSGSYKIKNNKIFLHDFIWMDRYLNILKYKKRIYLSKGKMFKFRILGFPIHPYYPSLM